MTRPLHKSALCLVVLLNLTACGAANGQTLASAERAGCGDDAFARAEKLRQEESPEGHAKALELYQSALRCNPEPPPSLKAAEILLGIGRVQFKMKSYQEARTSFSAALETFHQIHSEKREVQNNEAAAAGNLGIVLSRLGEIDQAMPIYREQRELFHRLQDKPREARILEELGHASFLMGDNQAALEYFSQAMRILDGLSGGPEERRRAEIHDFTGRVYASINEWELARRYFQDALTLARRINYHVFVAYTLNDLGMLLLRQNKIAAAASHHSGALKILREHEPEDTEGIAESEALLASCQARAGQYDAAIGNYQDALLLQQKSGDVIGQAETYLALGLAESDSHRMESALMSLTSAAGFYRRVHEREGESEARFEMARIHAMLGADALAGSEAMAAIQLAEEIRSFIPGPALRTAAFASLGKMYRFEIDLLLKNQPSISSADQELAFDLLQRARARTLLDALQNEKAGDDPVPDSELSARRTEFLQQLKAADQKLAWQLKNKNADAVNETFIRVKRLEASLDQLDAEAQAKQPRLAIASPITISIPAIQRELLDEKTALVQFYLSTPLSYAWVITKSGMQLVPLPPRAALERQVRNVVRFGESHQWTNAQGRALAMLERSLQPVFTARRNTRWIVAPDGALYSFPFALLSMNGAAEREIVKIPSASSIRALRSADSGAHAAYKLAVFADPVFDADDSRVRAVGGRAQNSQAGPAALRRPTRQSGNGSYPRLPYTRQEAALISAFVPREQQVSFRNFAASLDAVADNRLSDFKIIHFATHSLTDDRHPELSRIVLSLVTKEGAPRPGFLLLKDIYRMKLASDLVVLSSCRSATGREDAGEGPMSLARAFLFAGSRSVMSTLWEADDETTAGLMGRFYRHMLKERLSPLQALARTQSEFRRHRIGKLRNPYYWAGFELYGDWQTP